ncbi:MAG: TetR/AcrR family transcriptional regulator [Steroidobacteraceae bacterium]
MATRDTLGRIADAALELFNEFGTAAVSTNRIADQCGISKGNLHYHFRTKQEVIRFLWQRAVDEMDAGWYSDHLAPTLEHMAAMFVRQLQLILRYRFFYREMANLLRRDKVLRQRFADNRVRRIKELERFFRALATQGHMRLPADERRLRSIIDITWILSENWLNYLEYHDREVTAESIGAGYNEILEVLQPYLGADPNEITQLSYPTIARLTTRPGGAG